MRNPEIARGRGGHFERWLSLQREMQSALRARLDAMLEALPGPLDAYRARYERSFPAWIGEVLRPGELGERLAGAEIVLVGDYHSLAQSQRTALRLLRRLRRRGVAPALGLEMLPSRAQGAVDDFLAGRISSSALGELACAERLWDFPWRPVQALLDFARYHRLPVIALNRDVDEPERALPERDRHAAALLLAQRAREPERPLFVVFGDFHLAAPHLPRALRRNWERAGLRPPTLLRVFQNHEPLYWDSLGPRGRVPEILALASGDVCIQSATPLVKLQSYLYWLNFHVPAEECADPAAADPAELSEDLGHEVDLALRRIARCLHLPLLERPAPRVYWLGEATFARRIARESGWDERELALVVAALRQGEDCYLPERDLAVIAEPGQNRVAELAARVLLGRCSPGLARPRTLVDDFYLRVIVQALIFLGSRLINPLRKSASRPALLRSLREGRGQEGVWRRRAELLLGYLEAERRFLSHPDAEGFAPEYYRLDGPDHLALTRGLGRHLGGRLHEALNDGRLDPFHLRELWFEPFHLEGSPLRVYLGLLDRLGMPDAEPPRPGEGERL